MGNMQEELQDITQEDAAIQATTVMCILPIRTPLALSNTLMLVGSSVIFIPTSKETLFMSNIPCLTIL